MGVAHQDAVDIVGADLLVLNEGQRVEDEPGEAALVFARLGEHPHVRRRLAESRGGGFGIGIGLRRRNDVRRDARPLEILALVVRRVVGDLIGRRESLDLRLAEAGAVGIAEGTEGNAQAMAGRADLFVYLEAALELRLIVDPEQTGEAPVLARRLGLRLVGGDIAGLRRGLAGLRGGAGLSGRRRRRGLGRGRFVRLRGGAEGDQERKGRGTQAEFFETDHVAISPGDRFQNHSAGIAAGRTASAIEAGSGLVFSNSPSSGRTIRKKAK